VSALYGFTRLEPAPTQDDGELEDIRLAVSGAPLAKETSWLRAIEQLGEGLFLHFDEREIQSWISRPEVKERATTLQVAHDKWWGDRKASREAPPAPGIAYVLLHLCRTHCDATNSFRSLPPSRQFAMSTVEKAGSASAGRSGCDGGRERLSKGCPTPRRHWPVWAFPPKTFAASSWARLFLSAKRPILSAHSGL